MVLDKKRSFYDFLDLSSHFVPLCEAQTPEIIVDEIIWLAQKYPDNLPLLIPCSTEYEELVKLHSQELSTVFVICDPDRIFTDSPLANIP